MMENCISCGKLIGESSTHYCSECANNTYPIKCEETCKKCKWHLYNGCFESDCIQCLHTDNYKCLCAFVQVGESCKYFEEDKKQ